MKSRIMYIEDKTAGLSGPARIGRVTFSKTGRTLYYEGRRFKASRARACPSPTTTTSRRGRSTGSRGHGRMGQTVSTANGSRSSSMMTSVMSIGPRSEVRHTMPRTQVLPLDHFAAR